MYLVTGGAGFIGSNIVQTLVEKGESVRVLDNLSTGRKENLAGFDSDVDFIQGDLRDFDTVKKAVQGVTHVLHQGAMASVPQSVSDPISTNAANVDGTLNLLVAARDAGVSRLVFAGSCAVYGQNPTLPKTESMNPEPLTPYALQKLAGEFYCRQFFDLYGFEAVALRYFNVFGKRQDPKSLYSAVIPKFLDRIAQGKQPVIFGDGKQTRDFINIDDVVRANLTALEAPDAPGSVINIASGKRLSLLEIVAHLETILGQKIKPEFQPERDGDIRHSVADASLAQKLMGFRAEVPFVEGLEKYVAWFQKAGSLK